MSQSIPDCVGLSAMSKEPLVLNSKVNYATQAAQVAVHVQLLLVVASVQRWFSSELAACRHLGTYSYRLHRWLLLLLTAANLPIVATSASPLLSQLLLPIGATTPSPLS